MTSYISPLAKKISETMRAAKIKLEQLRISSDHLQLLEVQSTNAETFAQIRLKPPEIDIIMQALEKDDLVAVASWMDRQVGGDSVALSICGAAASATVALAQASDPDAPEVQWALDLLELTYEAAQLWHFASWEKLAHILPKVEATEFVLDSMTEEPTISRAKYDEMSAHAKRVFQKLMQLREAQKRGTEESARRRKPERDRRVQAFVDAIRADPFGGPRRWSAAVSKQAFGGSEERHVDNAGRWFRQHRGEIEAACSAERPPEALPPLAPVD